MAQNASSRAPEQILIVVGAHPNAERSDRPAVYSLREQIAAAIRARPHLADAPPTPPEVLVITDVWYLNDEGMRRSPAISVGSPGVNAFTAYLASQLPSAFAIDDVLLVQFDPAATMPLAACWGTTPARTAQAVTIFVERYLADFLDGALR